MSVAVGRGFAAAQSAVPEQIRLLSEYASVQAGLEFNCRGAVHHFERDAGSGVGILPLAWLGKHGAIADGDVLEVAAGFRAQLEAIAGGGKDAVGDREVFRRTAPTERKAGLGHNRVVEGLDETVGDADVPATVGIYAIAVAIEDRHALDVDVLASKQTEVVVR